VKKLINSPARRTRREGMAAHPDLRISYEPALAVLDAPCRQSGHLSGWWLRAETDAGSCGPWHVGRGVPWRGTRRRCPTRCYDDTKPSTAARASFKITPATSPTSDASWRGPKGIDVASVVINDDVAVQDSLATAGRRRRRRYGAGRKDLWRCRGAR